MGPKIAGTLSDTAQQLEALIQSKVERAIAPWRDKLPDFMVANLREHADEYYRANPVAVRVLDMLVARAARQGSERASGPISVKRPLGRKKEGT